MDLLQYESSSDDDDDGHETLPTVVAGPAAGPKAATTPPAATAASVSTSSKSKTVRSKRGKKVLSLQAVLPQHILEQLTKSQVRSQLAAAADSDDDDDDDSSDDGDNGDYANAQKRKAFKNDQKKKPATATAVAIKKAAHVVGAKADAGISSFLSELHAAPVITAAGPVPRLSSSLSYKPPSSSSAAASSVKKLHQPMGAAFLSATTVTVSTSINNKSNTTSNVRDIHGEESSTSSEMMLHQTSDVNKKATRKQLPAPAPAPQLQEPSSSMNKNSTNTGMGLRLPVVMAAPRVRAAPAIAVSAMMKSQQQQEQPATAGTSSHVQEQHEPAATAEALQKSGKRSRKEMERLLRHGQLDDAVMMKDTGMTCMDQAAPDQYAQHNAPEGEMVDSSLIQQHGVRVVPTPMYDASSGQTVKGIGGARGKNQISHLLQSAASLELSRARDAASSTASSSTQIGKTNRANAKRKYGW